MVLITNIVRAHRAWYASERVRLASMLASMQMTVRNDDAEFRRAWRKACLLIHPDKCKEPRGEDALKLLNNCYRMCFGM